VACAVLLGHVAKEGAAGIYDRAELLKRRRRALQRWADLVEAVEAGELPRRVLPAEGERFAAGSRRGSWRVDEWTVVGNRMELRAVTAAETNPCV